jgi:hypothetical protein
LSGYLPDVDVFNCKVAPIGADDPWPPPGSTYQPVSTYGELYKTGAWAPLHATYMLLWNYQGWNDSINPGAFTTSDFGLFVGPTKASSKVKLVVQDALMFKTNNAILFPDAKVGWYSSHNMKDSLRSKGSPFYMQENSDRRAIPDVPLNAGYLDGHVGRFRAGDGLRVGAAAHESMISRESGESRSVIKQ